MKFKHTTEDIKPDDLIVKWSMEITESGECDIYANQSLIFSTKDDGNIEIKCKCEDNWIKCAKLIYQNGELTTDYK